MHVAPPRTLTVRGEGRRSPARRDDGRYAVRNAPRNSTLSFAVTGAGRTLRAFRASVTTFCFGPTPTDNRLLVTFARLPTARIAPDGTVVAQVEVDAGREVLRGRLRAGRFVGRISVALSTCSGTRSFTAVRR